MNAATPAPASGPRFDLPGRFRQGPGLHAGRQQVLVKEFVAPEHDDVRIDEPEAVADVARDEADAVRFGELARL